MGNQGSKKLNEQVEKLTEHVKKLTDHVEKMDKRMTNVEYVRSKNIVDQSGPLQQPNDSCMQKF
jgi:prefoldin subunit 5